VSAGRKSYRLERRDRLLLSRAAVGGINGQAVVLRLLLDTGSIYTMLPVEVLESVGYDTSRPLSRVRMIAASGIVVAPIVSVSWFHCLGQRVENFPIAVHTLPSGTFVDGLLGMDFLLHHEAVISVKPGEVRLSNAV
jgi:predicted aspartyl protease